MSDKQVAMRETRRQIRPLTTIWEENGTITLRLEMPGVPKDGTELEIEGSELRIRGRRSAAPAGKEYLLRERADGDFAEVYTIDETVDRGKVDANMEAGILTLTLRLREAEKPRRIQIEAR
jgi:HSP20 family protein